MKNIIQTTTLLGCLALALAPKPVALAPDSADRAQAAKAKMDSTRAEVAKIRHQVGLTLEELNRLRKENVDLRTQFKTFSAELVKMEAQAKVARDLAFRMGEKGQAFLQAWEDQIKSIANEEIREEAMKRSDDMKSRGKAYFDQWEKELATLNDPQIRQLAQPQKLKLQGTFDALRSVMEPARDQFNAWLSGLKDLQKYLSNDLSISGIDAAKDLLTKTKDSGREIQATLDHVIAELNTIAATLTP